MVLKDIENIKTKLEQVYDNDQNLRIELDDIILKKGNNSKEVKELFKKINKKDKENLLIVTSVLDTYGWLSESVIGKKANRALFLVIQHSNMNIREKYHHMIDKALTTGSIDSSDFALFQDRFLLDHGKKQIYGTQFRYTNEDNRYELEPLYNPNEVNIRRKQLGLEPIEEDFKRYNIEDL